MSTSADSALVSGIAFAITYSYCIASATGLLIYYYLTTLDGEFKHYSKRKFTLATVLYITNRYIPLAYTVYNAPWISFSSREKICTTEMGIGIGLQLLQYFPWAIFSALRTYALKRKLYWAAVVLILSLAPVIINGILYPCGFRAVAYECSAAHKSLIAPVLARLPVIIADIVVIYVTWKTQYKAYGLSKDLRTPMRLTTVLLRDGSIYFVLLTGLNILALIFEYLQIGKIFSLDATFLRLTTAPSDELPRLTSILVSKFLNDLREAADKMSGPETLSSVSNLEFRIVGSIGASLPGPSDDGTPDDAGESCHNAVEGSVPEVDQNSGVVGSGAKLGIEEVARDDREV
ncbi:hypothetical protein ONZ51_g12448 [Trametes cubensis]|uniref:DUF6533 domain-containing protein n=1 Tax=Trametes cubensis TaxID=1111947 RepID=A0AAD7X4W5_9APHY|nr:hypothetical protein ONZ51_g12448 [Trametes cubensis]